MANTDNNLTDRLLLVAGVALFALGQSLNFLIVAPMARAAGLTVPQFGIAFTIASLPMIFAAPFWGRRSDALGRKPVFIIGSPRSGTSILTWALGQHPNLYPLEETVCAYEDLIRQGKILYWGVSDWSAQHIAEACRVADAAPAGLARHADLAAHELDDLAADDQPEA